MKFGRIITDVNGFFEPQIKLFPFIEWIGIYENIGSEPVPKEFVGHLEFGKDCSSSYRSETQARRVLRKALSKGTNVVYETFVF